MSRPDLFVIDGGVVSLPGASRPNFNLGIDTGLAYACMAEIMILALERQFEDISIGIDLDMDKVREMGRLAAHHGFRPASCKPLEGASMAKAA